MQKLDKEMQPLAKFDSLVRTFKIGYVISCVFHASLSTRQEIEWRSETACKKKKKTSKRKKHIG